MRLPTFITTMLPFFLCLICSAKAQFVKVRYDGFLDSEGRQIILHGVNIVDKSKEHNYLSWHGPEEFARMREWGFNCIRLGVFWDAVEPEPGRYDDEYLAGVDKRVQWAKENGIYVLLDMHQDLFSARFGGDGAPEWAVLDGGKPHIHPGTIWSAAYFTSPAVQTAFDNFWANKPASDGVGIQDHFAEAWQHVARRYAHEPAVIGYDVFNEPFPGSGILQDFQLKMQAAAEAFAKKQEGKALSVGEITQILAQPSELRKYADDLDLYRAFIDGGTSLSNQFESTVLASFYNRVARAIRRVDQNHLIFIETHISCNAGTPSGVVPILDADVSRDPLQAFAPHGYDVVTDTPEVAEANEKRIELIFDRHAETVSRLEMPALVGEWGAFYGQPGTLSAAQMVVRQLEKHLFSDTYWSYGDSKEMDDAPYFPVIARPYPSAVSGTLFHCQSDLENGTFTCTWKEDASVTSPSRIYLPARWFPDGYNVDLEPEAEGWSFEPAISGSDSGYLVIPPMDQEVERKLKCMRWKRE